MEKFWSAKTEGFHIEQRNRIIEKNKNIDTLKQMIFDPIESQLWDDRGHYTKEYQAEFNKYIFRCDEFKQTHDGKHILFMGCSETQGSNDSLDDTWAYILYKKISELEKLSGYFNIAKCGSSIFLQISIFLKYIEKFGVPEEIYFLAPGTDRNLLYSGHNQNIDHRSFFLYGEENYERLVNSFTSNVTQLNMLEEICKILNVNIFWSTWSDQDEELFLQLPFKNFFSLNMLSNDTEAVKHLAKYIDEQDFKSNMRKSDGHRGKAWHKYWAKEFYDKRYPN